jgi:hypothetical protein
MKSSFFGFSAGLLLTIALAGFAPALAHADDLEGRTVFLAYNLNGDTLQMYIVLGDPDAALPGYYNIMSVSDLGWIHGNATSLDPTAFQNLLGNNTDNLIDPTSAWLFTLGGTQPPFNPSATPPLFDGGGIGYFVADSSLPYAFYFDSGTSQYEGCWVTSSSTPLECGGTPQDPQILLAGVSPEPPSLLLLCAGIPVLFYLSRKLTRPGKLLSH